MMTKTLLATTCALSLVACIKQDDAPDALTRAIPTADQVSIKLPGGQARAGAVPALGQLAEWYVTTRDVTRTFNGGATWVLILIHTIVQYPVTTVSGNTYTWGPWSDALDPAEYKLDVRDVGDGTYAYTFSGRSKTESNAQFTVLIDGKADPRKGELQSNGEFLLDFDAGRKVNPIDADPNAKGQIVAHYDLATRHLGLDISTRDDKGNIVTADYGYNEGADGSGDMVFSITGDVGGGPALEDLTVRSRWQKTGLGRADVRIVNGDAGTGATGSECWDTQFKETFYTDSAGFKPTVGAPSSCGTFAAADLPPEN